MDVSGGKMTISVSGGEVSSSATSWENIVAPLTVNSNWSGRTVYYRNSLVGTYIITVILDVGGKSWTTSQNIIISSTGGTSDDSNTVTTTSDTGDTTTTTSTSNTNTNSVSNTTSTHYEAESLSTYTAPVTSFSVSAGRERISYVGAPISFEAKYKVTGEIKGKKPSFKWSMGDGAFLNKENVVHYYKYPGEYNVVLNAKLNDLDSISRTKVKVLVLNISMINKADGAIEISNKGSNEINLYGFKLQSGNTTYSFPIDTIISAGKSVTFPAEYLALAQADKISLLDASNKVVLGVNNVLAVNNKNEIDQTELEKFVLEYQRILALNNKKVITPPAVSNTVLGSTTEKYWSDKYEEDTKRYMVSDIEEPADETTSIVPISPKSPGFWSKIFHPVRTVKETFYQ